jgi:hypothetical protein
MSIQLFIVFVMFAFLLFFLWVSRGGRGPVPFEFESFDNQESQESKENQMWNFISKNVRTDCKNSRNVAATSLDDCRKQCASDTSCNVINYDAGSQKSCFLETCSQPDKFDFKFSPEPYPGSEVWGLSQDTTEKGKEKGADTRPGPGPSPSPSINCPDMSKYIRLDEIPCWNCSLP